MHVAILLAAAAAVLSAQAANPEPIRTPVLLAQADAPAADAKPAEDAPKPKKKARRKTKKQLAAEKAEALKKAEEAQKAEEAKKAADAKAAQAEEEKKAADAKAAETAAAAAAAPAPAAPETPAEAPPPAPVITETPAAPAADAPPPVPATDTAPPPAPDATAAAAPADGADNDPPTLSHTPVTHAPRARPLHLEARAVDPSGVFQVVLYLRRHGGSDFIPFKMTADKIATGSYSVDLPTALVSTDLEYYVETYDNAGNGPARTGTPERPLQIKLDEPIAPKPEEEKTKIVLQQQKPPPAITHSSVNKVQKGKSVELVAKMRGTAGVSKPSVAFRQLGDADWKTLPMGNLGETYTATIPASQTTKDIEYYVEAFDGTGVSPSHSGSADAPFLIRVEDEPIPKPPLVVTNERIPRRQVREAPPFKANPGQAAGYLFLAGAVGGLAFAGGEAYAAWQGNENYQHTLKFEGRNDPALLKRANEYGSRAKTFAIAGGVAAVVATVLLIVFSDHSDGAPPAGSGGDVPLFKF